MKSPGLLGTALLGSALAFAAGIRASEPASVEELFKWGEYDSLIQVLEPGRPAVHAGSASLATRADSAEEARARLYLGVAYWAKGRTEAGSRAFLQATRLDPDLRLDPLYATPEMAAHFERLAEVSQRLQSAALPAPAPAPADGDGKPRKPGRGGASPWWKWGGAAGLAVAGTLTAVYFATRSAEPPKERITVIDPGDSRPATLPKPAP
jgi:hypothetical protein